MELIYMYIQNYNGILKDLELNFSSKHIINVKDGGNSTFDISIEELESPINIFNNNSNGVNSIFSIIGKNGVGKSTILKAIAGLNFIGFFILKSDKSNFTVHYSDNLNISGLGFKKRQYNYNPKGELPKFIPSLHKIYYDNIFNPFPIEPFHFFGSDWEKSPTSIQRDISTNFYFFQELIGDQLSYVSNETKNSLILFNEIRNNQFSVDFEISSPKFFYIKNIIKSQIIYDYSKEDKDNFLHNLIQNIIFILFFKTILSSRRTQYLNEDETYLLDVLISNITKNIHLSPEDIYDGLANDIKENVDIEGLYKLNNERNIKGIRVIKEFKNLMNRIKDNLDFEENKLKLNIEKEEVIIEVKKFLLFVKKNSIGDHFFEYSYDRDYSSGERALITLFSRLVSISKEINDNLNINDLLVLLDEPEIFAHPEWQRKSIDNLIRGLNSIFPNKRVKIILTSHSPFIASDLPKENVIMLKKDNEGNAKVVKEKPNTFGANIFDLYKNAFFVESGFGEFAKTKIQDIIELLKTEIHSDGTISYPKKKEIENRKYEIEYIIRSIGEPLIQNKLTNLYSSFLNNTKSKDERIKELKKELERLEGDINDKNKEI